MSKWISCKDQMPEIDTPVLITVKLVSQRNKHAVCVGLLSDDDGEENMEWFVGDDGVELNDVTHWMPLPDAAEPKEGDPVEPGDELHIGMEINDPGLKDVVRQLRLGFGPNTPRGHIWSVIYKGKNIQVREQVDEDDPLVIVDMKDGNAS